MRADETMAEALASAAHRHSDKLKKRLRRAARGAPDGVHDARTELRRIRILLDLMGSTVFGRRRARRLERDLHDVERRLAKVRDTDVLLAALRDYLRDHPNAQMGLEELALCLEARRRSAARAPRREVRDGGPAWRGRRLG